MAPTPFLPLFSIVTWTTPATVTNCILYYKAASDADWTIDNNASSPYTLSGLNPSTNYTVRVASDCGDGEHFSPFITETFFTNCAPMTAIPYSENFDSYAGTTSTSTNVLPVCWSRLNNGTSYAGLPTIYNSSSYAHSGSNSLYFYTYTTSGTYDDQYAILPEIDVVANPLNTLQISMSARSYSTSYPFVIQVGVMTDPTQASTFS